MPPAGSKPSDESFTNIIAYILERNGQEAGSARLVATATTLVPTRDVVAGRAPAAVPATAARRADTPRRPGGPGAPPPPLPSLQWNDVVEDYRPVTAEMLLDPPPGDWLMFRRTYDGQGHSPLDQITTENVGDLQLAWVWSMADGSNQPTPLVHDGIMYLTNPGNIIQALDARMGDVIWQYAREFPEGFSRGGSSRLRNILDLPGQAVHLDRGRCAGRARRAEWRDRLGSIRSRTPSRATPARAGRWLWAGSWSTASTAARGSRKTAASSRGTIPTPARSSGGRSPIAQPGEPGGDSWGDLPLVLRGGGDSWIAGSYDPELDLIYWPTAQAKPWVPASRGLTVHRRRALHQRHAGATAEHRRDPMVLPARAGRGARPR